MKPPPVSPAVLRRVILSSFPFKEVTEDSVKDLGGFYDRNYFFKGELLRVAEQLQEKSCPSQWNLSSGCLKEEDFVVKVMNTVDSKHPVVIDAMVASMEHVLLKGLRVPAPIAARDGSRFAQVSHGTLLDSMPSEHTAEPSSEYAICCVIVMTYLQGIELEKVPKSKELLYQFGALAGRLDAAWKTFYHPGVIQKSELDEWNLLKLPQQKVLLVDTVVKDAGLLALLQQGMSVYEKHVKDQVPKLARGVIHSDVHDMNVLCNEVADAANSHQLGIVDFGDVSDGPYIFELATVAVDAMYSSDAPLASLKQVVAGYTAYNPLPREDEDLLLHAVVGKITQWCLLSVVAAADDPGNSEYILRTFDSNVKLLEYLLHHLSLRQSS